MDEPSLQRLTQGQKHSIRLVFRNAAKERKNKKMQKRDVTTSMTDVALKEKNEKKRNNPTPAREPLVRYLQVKVKVQVVRLGHSHVRAARYVPPSDQ